MMVLTPSACASASARPQAATGIRRERQLADVGSLGNIVLKVATPNRFTGVRLEDGRQIRLLRVAGAEDDPPDVRSGFNPFPVCTIDPHANGSGASAFGPFSWERIQP